MVNVVYLLGLVQIIYFDEKDQIFHQFSFKQECIV
jgi:hypothetical protein